MAALIFSVIFIIAMVSIAVGIGFMCLEMVIRLIGRGLGAQLSTETTMAQRTTQRWNFR
jgi:hypothetical protein